MSDDPFLPPPPDPSSVAVWAGQFRAILPLLGGIGIGGAWLQHLTDAQISDYLTGILTAIGVASWGVTALWSRYDKWRAAKADRASSVASAAASAHLTQAAGRPVIVTVAPASAELPGYAPVATMVSPLEVASVALPLKAAPPLPAPAL
jgi:hypothetical protein